MSRGLLFIAFLLVSAEGLSASLTLAYTANRQGETEPCGCQSPDIGGLGRMAERLIQLKRSGSHLFVDAGNAFFSAPQLSTDRLAKEIRRAEIIAEAYHQMGLRAFSPGERDFTAGTDFFWKALQMSGAVAVSANLERADSGKGFQPFLFVEEGEFKVVLTGLTSFLNKAVPTGLKWREPQAAFREVWKTIQTKKPDRVVVLSHLGPQENTELARGFPGIWIIGSQTMDFLVEPQKQEESFLFEVGIGGQRLGEVEFQKAQPGWSRAQLIDLGKEYDIPNGVAKLLKALKKRK